MFVYSNALFKYDPKEGEVGRLAATFLLYILATVLSTFKEIEVSMETQLALFTCFLIYRMLKTYKIAFRLHVPTKSYGGDDYCALHK